MKYPVWGRGGGEGEMRGGNGRDGKDLVGAGELIDSPACREAPTCGSFWVLVFSFAGLPLRSPPHRGNAAHHAWRATRRRWWWPWRGPYRRLLSLTCMGSQPAESLSDRPSCRRAAPRFTGAAGSQLGGPPPPGARAPAVAHGDRRQGDLLPMHERPRPPPPPHCHPRCTRAAACTTSSQWVVHQSLPTAPSPPSGLCGDQRSPPPRNVPHAALEFSQRAAGGGPSS